MSSYDSETIYFERVIDSTDKAILYEFDDVGNVWIPTSQIREEDDLGDGSGSITIPNWLAVEKGLA